MMIIIRGGGGVEENMVDNQIATPTQIGGRGLCVYLSVFSKIIAL